MSRITTETNVITGVDESRQYPNKARDGDFFSSVSSKYVVSCSAVRHTTESIFTVFLLKKRWIKQILIQPSTMPG